MLNVFLFSSGCEVVVCESKLTWMGLRPNVYLHFVLVPACFRQIDSDKTLQVLQQRRPRSRWSRRFASSIEPVDTAGRVIFFLLFSDPTSSVARTAWCQVAELEVGRFLGVPCREKCAKVFLEKICLGLGASSEL